MACASPVTSPAVSPLIRNAPPKPAIWAGVAAPSMISFIAQAVSSAVSGSPLISAPIKAGQAARESIYGHLDPDQGDELRREGTSPFPLHSGVRADPVRCLSPERLRCPRLRAGASGRRARGRGQPGRSGG